MNDSQIALALKSPRTVARTVDGIEFDPTEQHWSIPTAQGRTFFNFDNLPGVTDTLRQHVRSAFASLLLANAPERLRVSLTRLRALFKFLAATCLGRQIDELTAADVQNYGASLPKHQESHLRALRSILVAWANTGVAGLSHDLLILLPALKTKRHETGVAVRTMDPKEGPLNDIEYESVIAAMRHAFASGTLSVSDYSLLVLAFSLGCRAMQLAMMKVKDLSITRRADGSKIYILQVTRLKQGKNIRPRTLFKARELAGATGALLEQQIAFVTRWALRRRMAPAEAPLFPATDKLMHNRGAAVPGLEGHHGGSSASAKIARLLNSLCVTSVRTRCEMDLFQTRIRRTFGSRAAAEGLPASVIADLMDHSWVDSCLVYIEARPEILERIDKAIALQLAPLAQAFAGTLAARPGTQTTDYGRTIHIDTPEMLEAIGGCGKFDFCGLAAPLACYTCSYFNPWLDSIHETLLERLLVEREELLGLSDLRMASINDRTILAVADVVNRCRQSFDTGVA